MYHLIVERIRVHVAEEVFVDSLEVTDPLFSSESMAELISKLDNHLKERGCSYLEINENSLKFDTTDLTIEASITRIDDEILTEDEMTMISSLKYS